MMLSSNTTFIVKKLEQDSGSQNKLLFNLVHVIAYIKLPTPLWYSLDSTGGDSALLTYLKLLSTGVETGLRYTFLSSLLFHIMLTYIFNRFSFKHHVTS